jgi:hypothetical protein
MRSCCVTPATVQFSLYIGIPGFVFEAQSWVSDEVDENIVCK